MKHISQQMLSMDLRKPQLQRFRRQLQESLRHPSLPSAERERLRSLLERVGKSKIYKLDDPPQPWAIDPGPMPVAEIKIDLESATFESLSMLPHLRLYNYAHQEGLEVNPGATKAQIIKMILVSSQGNR